MDFEIHVTTERVDVNNLQAYEDCCNRFKFRPANLLIADGVTPSGIDSFCTSHTDSYLDAQFKLLNFCTELKSVGIKIYRYKIEQVLMDSRIHDILQLNSKR